MSGANPARGEARLRVGGIDHVLRPSFERLVAAEEALGPLFSLVERAAAGSLTLQELVTLFWYCLEGDRPSREALGEAIVAGGIAAATPALRTLLGQILQGR